MIKLYDTALLALVKLRARKIRTITTVLLASLLFGVLVAVSLIATGTLRSVASFRQDGLTDRYIVSVHANPKTDTLYQVRRSPELIAKAKERYENLVEEKESEADRLGVRYAQASDQPPYSELPDGSGEALVLRDSNGIVQDLIEEYFKDKPAIDDEKLGMVAEQYHAIDQFELVYRQVVGGSTLEVLPDSGEVFYDESSSLEREESYAPLIIEPYAMNIAPSNLTEPFMLPDNAGWTPDSSTIPIILPQDKIEALLGRGAPADEAGASEKLEYLKRLREGAAGLTVRACYRNEASNALIQQALQQDRGLKSGEGDEDYRQPSITYGLPDPLVCENPNIVSDTRTDDEKMYDENQDVFDRQFNNKIDPESYFISFKVVGISPPQSPFSPGDHEVVDNSISDIVDSLLKTSGIGQIIPHELYDQLGDEEKERYADVFTYAPTYFMGNEDDRQRLVEFASASDAQLFIDEQGCSVGAEGICRPVELDYQLRFAFTNSAALDDIEDRFEDLLGYAIFGVVVLASVVMWIAIGRTIADGRHETAVFRAIGFNRGDIASIYTLYAVLLMLLIAVVSIAIGFIGAYVVDLILSPSLTAQTQYGFGGLDMSKEVSLIGLNLQHLTLIAASCVVTGVVATLIPLVGNVRRSPMRDMREG